MPIFWQIFDTFFQKYGQFKPMDLKENLSQMKKEWDLSTLTEKVFAQINDANKYSIFAKSPFTNANIVHAGKIILLRTR